MTPATTLRLIRPDDWHVHFRDDAMLRAVAPHTARVFGRAIIMPNLGPPIITTAQAAAYQTRIMQAVQGYDFAPLMTLYLTETTDPHDVMRGLDDKIITALKLYPAHATTNSAHGVVEMRKVYRVLEVLQRHGAPLLVHGEVTHHHVDIFDREKVFIDTVLIPLRADFPELKVVMEHITTTDAADYVRENCGRGTLAATITPHHLMINRNAMFKGGLRPHYYCLPVAKREHHRAALVRAATSGLPCYFLGTDTAPHATTAKESACGCAGIFNAPNALECYAQVFEDDGKLENLEKFASLNGPAFYGLPVNKTFITLEKTTNPLRYDEKIAAGGVGDIAVFNPEREIFWKVS
ncbi:MAG: dihydroorotase [Alphaproteobacteria bacterium]|nr:dihydroorotase [Alphaproteobacteria bacterium]